MEIKDLKEKGCVYFFKHIGLEPVKIGYSASPSPEKRFSQFKTYAPFGAELLGFIICDNAKELESKLHQKYSNKRLDGEWFLISIKDINNEIETNTSKEIVKFKNELQIKLAKEINKIISDKKEIKNEEIVLMTNNYYTSNFENFKKIYHQVDKDKINKKALAKQFGVSRGTIYNWIKEITS